MNLIEKLHSKGLIKPPPFVIGGTQYLTIMGSQAYGVSSGDSDVDIYGWCIPPKDVIFPHLAGEIEGFGAKKPRFDQYTQHHILEKDTGNEYDISVYNIVKYFSLVMENNPNMIDSLFTPRMCVIHSTALANHVRDNRKIFLHKGAWHRFKGYAYSQMQKMKVKNPDPGSKRYENVLKHGYDVKFAYHIVRLLSEVEMILTEHDLDITRNNDQLKSIRRGEWTLGQIEQYFVEKERDLEKVYLESTLQKYPDEEAVKKILLEVLEIHFGSLDGLVQTTDHYKNILRQIQQLVSKV